MSGEPNTWSAIVDNVPESCPYVSIMSRYEQLLGLPPLAWQY